jgi:phosphatidylglycerophosphate synthase
MFIHLPNVLSVLRIISGYLVIILYDPSNPKKLAIALVVALVGELTDHLDGAIARRLNVTSKRGYILDGLGDRAFYSALILTFYRIHSVSATQVWLLLFGQMCVYAVRVLQGDWYSHNHNVRKIHLLHWGGIRLWVLTFMLADALSLYSANYLEPDWYATFQAVIAWTTIVVLYYGIFISTSFTLRDELEQSNQRRGQS